MADFTLVDREFGRVPVLLTEVAPGFARSDEYARLDSSDFERPTVVCGAFNRYLCRLQQAVTRAELDHDEARDLRDAYRAIDRLSESEDLEVVNLVVVEIFEHLDLDDAALAAFRNELGETTRDLYDRWITAPGR